MEKIYSQEDLIKGYNNLKTKLRRQPVFADWKAEKGLPSETVIKSRFRRWNLLVVASGDKPIHYTKHNLDKILDKIIEEIPEIQEKIERAYHRGYYEGLNTPKTEKVSSID